jgi:hypothetical protein
MGLIDFKLNLRFLVFVYGFVDDISVILWIIAGLVRVFRISVHIPQKLVVFNFFNVAIDVPHQEKFTQRFPFIKRCLGSFP